LGVGLFVYLFVNKIFQKVASESTIFVKFGTDVSESEKNEKRSVSQIRIKTEIRSIYDKM